MDSATPRHLALVAVVSSAILSGILFAAIASLQDRELTRKCRMIESAYAWSSVWKPGRHPHVTTALTAPSPTTQRTTS